MKKIFLFIFRIAISIALLGFLFTKIDFKATFKIILGVNIYYLILIFISFLAIYILAFLRWDMLLRAQQVKLPLLRVIASYSGGLFFNLFLPSTIGGDIARSIDLGGHTKRTSAVAATVLLDRLSGFVGLVIVAVTALLIGHKSINMPVVYVIVGLLALFLGIFLLILFNKKIYSRINGTTEKRGIKAKLARLHSEIYFFRSKPFLLISNLMLSIVIQGGSSLISYLAFRALNVGIKAIYPFILTPIISTVTTLPIAIGGAGLRENTSVFFYKNSVALSDDAACAQALLNTALVYLFGLLAGIIYVSTFHYRRLQSDRASG